MDIDTIGYEQLQWLVWYNSHFKWLYARVSVWHCTKILTGQLTTYGKPKFDSLQWQGLIDIYWKKFMSYFYHIVAVFDMIFITMESIICHTGSSFKIFLPFYSRTVVSYVKSIRLVKRRMNWGEKMSSEKSILSDENNMAFVFLLFQFFIFYDAFLYMNTILIMKWGIELFGAADMIFFLLF